MHQHVFCDSQSLEEIANSTVQDLPRLMEKIGFDEDMEKNVLELSATITDQDDIRLVNEFLEPEEKKAMYHRSLVKSCQKHLGIKPDKNQRKEKEPKKQDRVEREDNPEFEEESEDENETIRSCAPILAVSDQHVETIQGEVHKSTLLDDKIEKQMTGEVIIKISSEIITQMEQIYNNKKRILLAVDKNRTKKSMDQIFSLINSIVQASKSAVAEQSNETLA